MGDDDVTTRIISAWLGKIGEGYWRQVGRCIDYVLSVFWERKREGGRASLSTITTSNYCDPLTTSIITRSYRSHSMWTMVGNIRVCYIVWCVSLSLSRMGWDVEGVLIKSFFYSDQGTYIFYLILFWYVWSNTEDERRSYWDLIISVCAGQSGRLVIAPKYVRKPVTLTRILRK